MEEIYDRLPNEPLDMPDLDDLNFGVGNSLSDDDFDNDDDGEGSGSDSKCHAGDEVIEEFRRERVKDNEARQAKLEELTRKE